MNSKVLLTLGAVLLGACASQVDPEPTDRGSESPAQGTAILGGANGAAVSGIASRVASSASSRIRLITDAEYVSAVRDVLGIALVGPEAEIASAISTSDFTFTENLAQSYQAAAQNVARQAVDPVKMQSLLGNGQTPATAAELDAFLATKVARLWGRRVAPAEAVFLKNIYTGSAALADGGAAHAFDMLLQAVLQAPSFLYRVETTAGLGGQ
jgi:hypothetical protein